jgi:hypothetical protein
MIDPASAGAAIVSAPVAIASMVASFRLGRAARRPFLEAI